uniref:Ammonium transporter n=1 Tax=Candidatus Kentrum sp. FM TaxID=2126340 RepID=A0A450S803_9GAMM|nr:MAG: ammonium transporter, Amt family [Candidatus Kentron sp. FM]VFJ63427.1 MAG: ammonium transporter, Amt family [Candidatus Kentron sp. FM]VFK15720.1 MAG: ammonium transporter, Amt family [Candidatus Kentron sp. FM]
MQKRIMAFALPLAFSPGIALAGEGALDGANTAWILTATALVLFMTIPGLSLFYAGLVRTKNVLSIMMQCFAITCLMSLLWFGYGYSLAFGEGNAYIGDLGKAFLMGVDRNSLFGDIPETVFMAFQMTFAIITPALVVGGFAERMKFSAMLLFSALWLTLVYVPVTHWVWGGGWLGAMGLYDFAGGTVVHITAGVSAITAAVVMGPRKGFPGTSMPPHNLAISVAGAGMLWVGWYGFNAGSALAANGDAGMALLVTHISAAAGSLAWMGAEWVKYGKPSVLGIITGMVAGLGTITPASGFVGPGGALVIGIAAGLICFTATNYLKRVLKIDDSLDVFPVHGVGGILGTLAAGVFASTGLGVFSGFGFAEGIDSMADQVSVQSIGVLSTVFYSAIISFVVLKILDVMIGLRVTTEEETEGLDIILHEERGYNL